MTRVRLRDLELGFDDVGSGQPVVFLHGYPFDRSMWREQLDFLGANDYRAIAPDMRGLGETGAAGDISTMDEMARDTAALLDELTIGKSVICGLSMGGYVALEFAQLFPSRVSGLVLAGTRAPADNEKEKQARELQVNLMLAEGMTKVAEGTLPKLVARRTLAEKPEVVSRVREMILQSDPEGASAAQRGMAARRDYSDDLSAIRVSTLIIVGKEDTIRPPSDAEFMQSRLRNSRLEIFEDAAHMTNMERPDLFNEALKNFLSGFRGSIQSSS